IVGISDAIVTAAISPHLIPTVVIKAAMPTVIVLALDPVKTDAKRYSFQLKIKTMIEDAAKAGDAKGKITLLIVLIILAPSTIAASSKAVDIPSIPDFISHIANGR
ncbi:MAG: hypothetical protein QXU67_03940, partial [Candidatus Bathyarchaeia archaeon]